MIKLKKFRIHLSSFVLAAISAFLGVSFELVISYIVLLLHETAHWLIAKRLGATIKHIDILPFGISISFDDMTAISPLDEAIICAAGPMANSFLALCAYYFKNDIHLLGYFMYANAAIFFINILPIMPLDGGRILKSYIIYRAGINKADKYMIFFSQVSIAVVGVFIIMCLIKNRFNISLMMLCSFLIYNISLEKKEAEFNRLKQISSMKSKLKNKAYMNSKTIAVSENAEPFSLLKDMSYDSLYFINVCDENMHYKATLSEQEIVDEMVAKSSDIKISDILQKKDSIYKI